MYLFFMAFQASSHGKFYYDSLKKSDSEYDTKYTFSFFYVYSLGIKLVFLV